MLRKAFLAFACTLAVGGAAWWTSLATADMSDTNKPAMKLPPGWTDADMKAMVEAGTPGKNHALLAKSIGVWEGKCTSWMGPDSEPMKSDCTNRITTIMDGRFTKCEFSGEMPQMGTYNGLGTFGYDNAGKKFVSTWLDNHSTGIMTGTGELSSDGKTITWNYTYNCPIAKKPVNMREVERHPSDDTMTLEMFGEDPKSGKEFKMMSIEFTRRPPTAVTGERQ